VTECLIKESDVARHVRKSLKEYFKDLDGEEPCCGMYNMVMGSVEKSLIESVLAYSEGNQTHAAEMLGINRNTLRKKMQLHDIE